jgi:hypothetical protein
LALINSSLIDLTGFLARKRAFVRPLYLTKNEDMDVAARGFIVGLSQNSVIIALAKQG